MVKEFALVIDDNVDNVEMYTMLMSIQGYATKGLQDGEQAIQWLTDNDAPDVISLDMNMPRVDGRQVYEFLRKDPKFEKTRVVIVTANSYMIDEMASILSEGDHILQKPFKMADLQTIIRIIRQQK